MKTTNKPEARIFPVVFSLPFILCVFALVSAACLILLSETVDGIFSDDFFHSPRGFFMLFVIPLSFIILAAFLFYGLGSEILKTGRMHSGGLRVFHTVCVFAVLVALLFCVFSSRFIHGLFSIYHDEHLEHSVANAVDIAEEYAKTRRAQIQTVADRFLTGLNIGNQRAYPRQWIPEIRDFDPHALAVQVYLEDPAAGGTGEGEKNAGYLAVKEEGDSSVFIAPGEIAEKENGIFMEYEKRDGETLSCMRIRKTARYAGNNYICLYTSAFPPEITEATRNAEETGVHISKLKKLSPVFPYFGVWLFSGFILPPVLILLLAAFYLCVRFSDPLAVLNRTSDAVSHGVADASVVAHRLDGLAEITAFVNAAAENIRAAQNSRKNAPPAAHTDAGTGANPEPAAGTAEEETDAG